MSYYLAVALVSFLPSLPEVNAFGQRIQALAISSSGVNAWISWSLARCTG